MHFVNAGSQDFCESVQVLHSAIMELARLQWKPTT
jgi:hypothetical protein